MTELLYQAHSGLRYLVLLAGIVALPVLAYGLAAKRPVRAVRSLAATFTGLLDLQIVLGLALVALGIFYPALMGHITLMVVAAAAAHGSAIGARRSADERRALAWRLGGVLVALLCIVLGILAIGRSVFGSAPPTAG